jgi:oxygen-independent coproporphyrinogen III oxidase
MQPLGIYIQFPFCASKCSFCNFSSRVGSQNVYPPYIEALNQEVDLALGSAARGQREPDGSSPDVDTVYCGGGTPSLAGAEGLEKMFEPIKWRFQLRHPLEWTLEITPASAGHDLLNTLILLGVNRLSIGAQSFIDRELRCVGRLHSASETEEQVTLAREVGFQNISLDLIAGLPYQTISSWQSSLEEVVRLFPQHVSVYLFEADEHSRLGKEVIRQQSGYYAAAMPGDDFMAEAYERAREVLCGEGYAQYEISNFALPGYESRHNRKYWERQPYLGFGAGAHSFDGSRRWSNESEPAAYQARLGNGELPIAESHVLSSCESVEEFFFLGLRQARGVSLSLARERWGRPPLNWWEDRARQLEWEGLLTEKDGRLRLAENAYLISNEVFQRFLT